MKTHCQHHEVSCFVASTPQSYCLDDEPRQVAELKFPDKLPGELYNADIQCKWQFGSKARLCTYDFGKVVFNPKHIRKRYNKNFS